MAPLLITVLIGFFVYAVMLLARYQLQDVTVATVRSCVALQNTGDSLGQYTQCLSTRFQYFYDQGGHKFCDSTPARTGKFEQLPVTGAFNGSSQQIYLLQLSVSCDYSIAAIAALLPGAASKITLNVTSAMPFVKG